MIMILFLVRPDGALTARAMEPESEALIPEPTPPTKTNLERKGVSLG